MGGIRFGSGLMDLILVPHGRRLRVPVDKIRLHAVCRRPKCQRDLYPPVFYCLRVGGRVLSGPIRSVLRGHFVVYIVDERDLRPERMQEPRFVTFVASLQSPKRVIGYL